MPKRASKKQGNPQARAAVFSAVLTVALILVLSAVGGMLILKGVLPENASGVIAAAAVLLAAFAGPLPLMKAAGKKRLPIAYVNMALLLVLLLLCKLIFWPAAPFGNWMALAAAPVGATLCGLLGSRKPKRKY